MIIIQELYKDSPPFYKVGRAGMEEDANEGSGIVNG